jgi:hypothetical protein
MTPQETLKEMLQLERERREERGEDAESFDCLLATLDDVPPSLWHAYAAARHRDNEAGIRHGGTFVEDDHLRAIGRREKPGSAMAFIEGYIEAVRFDRIAGSTRPRLK